MNEVWVLVGVSWKGTGALSESGMIEIEILEEMQVLAIIQVWDIEWKAEKGWRTDSGRRVAQGAKRPQVWKNHVCIEIMNI